MLRKKWVVFLLFSITLLVTIFNFKGFSAENSNVAREDKMQQINLSIRPTKEEFSLSAPIFIEVTFENKSSETIFLNDIFNVFQCQLQFDITMPLGGRPHEIFTATGKMRPLCKKDFIKIPKGKAVQKIVNISEQWYRLDQKGKYLITAIYSNSKSWDELGIKVWTGSVKSKTVAFIIK